MDGLNKVNYQPSKKVTFYRQPSKMQIDRDINCPKISRHFSLAFFSISADHHGLLAPEESSSKIENHFPCSQKHPF